MSRVIFIFFWGHVLVILGNHFGADGPGVVFTAGLGVIFTAGLDVVLLLAMVSLLLPGGLAL